jgi:phenylpyruvate tautomerase PptA (4-oxalocrotonate tautomerase family)
MPTYTLTTPAHRLTPDQKARAAAGITRVHNAVTGAASFFAQVIVNEVPAGNYFLGGRPLVGGQLFLHGQIRAGRSALDRRRLLLGLRDIVAEAAGVEVRSVWVYLVDLPAGDMVEYGHILPEPGSEDAWLAGLQDADRAYMKNVEGSR